MADIVRQISDQVDSTLELCDAIQKAGCWVLEDKITMRKSLLLDLLSFCMYLCCSDGTIKQDEADYIRVVLGYDMTPAEISQFVKDNHIYSTKFESEVPTVIRGVYIAGEMLKRKGFQGDLLAQFIEVYKSVGAGILAVDANLTDSERNDYNIFINTLISYYNA